MKPRFALDRDSIVMRLPEEERVFLSQVLDLLASVGASEGDRARQRLNVPVYLDDDESNQEWWRLMGEEMNRSRKHDRQIFSSVMDSDESRISVDEADAVLRVINEGRLAFAARLGLEVEDDHDRIPEPERSALDFLGWVLEDLTVTLSEAL